MTDQPQRPEPRTFQGWPALTEAQVTEGRKYLHRWYPKLIEAIEARAAETGELAEIGRLGVVWVRAADGGAPDEPATYAAFYKAARRALAADSRPEQREPE